MIQANENFLLVISYNPGYQTVLKDLKHSTRQRFVAVEFDYPPEELEREIVRHESGLSEETAGRLACLGAKVRNLREHGLQEGVSTRLLIYAGTLMSSGIAPPPGLPGRRGAGIDGRQRSCPELAGSRRRNLSGIDRWQPFKSFKKFKSFKTI